VADGKADAILDAALRLFDERTYAGCAMPLIADAAGVAAGTIYRYFPSKEALANALYRQWKARYVECLFADDDPGEPPRQRVERVWRALFDFAGAHPAAFSFLETHQHAPYLDAESRALSARLDTRAVAFVTSVQETGAVRDAPAAELISLFLGAFTGLVKARTAGYVSFDDALRTRSADAIWQLLTPARPDAPTGSAAATWRTAASPNPTTTSPPSAATAATPPTPRGPRRCGPSPKSSSA